MGGDLVSAAALRPMLAAGNVPQVVKIPGAGHFVQDEAPDEVRRVLLDWLERAVPPACR